MLAHGDETGEVLETSPVFQREEKKLGLAHWEMTCVNALAQDWLEHELGTIIRRELAAVTGDGAGELVFRAKSA